MSKSLADFGVPLTTGSGGILMPLRKTPMHPDNVVNWDGDLESLVNAIGNMKYDKLQEFLALLAQNIKEQSDGDYQRKRFKLSLALQKTSDSIHKASEHMADAWTICEPYMREQ